MSPFVACYFSFMTPLFNQNHSDLPENQRQWLTNPLPQPVKFVSKDPELGFALILLPLLLLPLLILSLDTLWRYSQNQRIDQGDVISGLLVTLPLAVWSLLRFRNRYRDHQKLKQGLYKVGVFCDGKTLLWCESFKYCHLFPLNSVKRLEVTAKPVHRVGWRPEDFVISGDEYSLTITNASAYGVSEVYDLITTWDSGIHFDLDSRLDEYFAKLRGVPQVTVPIAGQETSQPDVATASLLRKTKIDKPRVFVPQGVDLVPEEQLKNTHLKPASPLEAERLLFHLLVRSANPHMGTERGVDDGKPFTIYYFSVRPDLKSAQKKRFADFWYDKTLQPGVLLLRGDGDRLVVFQGIGDTRYPLGKKQKGEPHALRNWKKDSSMLFWPSAVEFSQIPADFQPIHSSHFKNILEASGISYFMDQPMRHATAFTAPEVWVFAKPLRLPLHFLRPILSDLSMGSLRDLQAYIDAEDWAHEVTIGKEGLYFDDWSEWECCPQAF